MNQLASTALGDALAERVRSLARADDRLRALDDYSESHTHIVGQPNAEEVLRRALVVLGSRDGYALALRMTAGDQVVAGDDFAQAGLVMWDPLSDSMRPTPLLVELMRVFESAVTEAERGR
jgi:hypothetical protein